MTIALTSSPSAPVPFRDDLHTELRAVLAAAQRFLHYRDAAEAAWRRLGWWPTTELEYRRGIEDVRLDADHGSGGLGYVGEPYCFVYLRDWFQPALFDVETPERVRRDAERDPFRWAAYLLARRREIGE